MCGFIVGKPVCTQALPLTVVLRHSRRPNVRSAHHFPDFLKYFQLQDRLKDDCGSHAAAGPVCSCFRQEEHLSCGKVKSEDCNPRLQTDGVCCLSGIMMHINAGLAHRFQARLQASLNDLDVCLCTFLLQHFILTFVAPAGCACWTPCPPPLTTDQSKGASALPSLMTENCCSSHHTTPAFEQQCDYVMGCGARVLHAQVLCLRWGQRVIIPAFTSIKINAVPTGDLPQRQDFLNCVWLSMCHNISACRSSRSSTVIIDLVTYLATHLALLMRMSTARGTQWPMQACLAVVTNLVVSSCCSGTVPRCVWLHCWQTCVYSSFASDCGSTSQSPTQC